jgi:hypothetical protein
MSCGGGHLGFSIGIKNTHFVEDIPMIIPGQFGFNCPSSDPMGKCSNAFFSETTNMIKTKLYMNVHWMVLYKLYVFCSEMTFLGSLVSTVPVVSEKKRFETFFP